MIRVPIGPLGLRRKLDVQWMKGTWGERWSCGAHPAWNSHLDEQCEDELETSEFSQIWWESSSVLVKIQLCLRPNF